jgi:hypothetical protein
MQIDRCNYFITKNVFVMQVLPIKAFTKYLPMGTCFTQWAIATEPETVGFIRPNCLPVISYRATKDTDGGSVNFTFFGKTEMEKSIGIG